MIPVKWKFRSPSPAEQIAGLSESTNLHPIICQILINRGIENTEAINDFLNPDLKKIPDPFLLKDMSKAVERIEYALKKGEKVLIYGDYDVDGITASAVLSEYLTDCGGKVRVRLPNRIKDGYGLSKKVIDEAHREGVTLLITVDCGSSDHEAAEYAHKIGIDMLITDHHHTPDTLPKSLAIINPKQEECPYPYKHLAGVGVALKLVQGLSLYRQGKQMRLDQIGFWPNMLNRYLDLVCLGTIADIMPLTGENRILVKYGLNALNRTERPGLIALKNIAGIADKDMTTGLVGFALAPRINATGRVSGPEEGLRLLLTKSPEEGEYLAKFLDQQNQKRREIEGKILRDVYKKIKKELKIADEMIIILSDKGWHPGVIGIVAQKLVEEFYRPAVIISIQSGLGKGSARSIPNIHLYELLYQCQELLKDFGGHAAAAGLTIEEKMIPLFREKANQILNETCNKEDLVSEITIDAMMNSISLDDHFVDQLDSLAPFGSENPEPSLCLKGVCLTCQPRLLKDAHLKIHMKYGSVIHEGIGFNMRRIWEYMLSFPPSHKWDVVFYPQFNHWRGENHIQLRLKDVKAHAPH